MTKRAKATKTQETTLRLIDGQSVSWPHERFVVSAIIASLEYGWITAKAGYEADANYGRISCHVDHYNLTDAGRSQI